LGSFPNEIDSSFSIRQARQLDSDTLRALTADARLADPKGVNPIADFFEGLVDGTGTEVLELGRLEIVHPHLS
jgi:hypothetical protein